MDQGDSLGDTNHATAQNLGTKQDVLYPNQPPQTEQSKTIQPTPGPHQVGLSSPDTQIQDLYPPHRRASPSLPWYQEYGLSESPFYQVNPQASPVGPVHSTIDSPLFPSSNCQQAIGPGTHYPGCYESRGEFKGSALTDYGSQTLFPSSSVEEYHRMHNKMTATACMDTPYLGEEACADARSIEQEKHFSESRPAESYDEDVKSIFNIDIPGFPIPPQLIPTSSLAIWPLPNMPCPPLPTGHMHMVDRKGKAPCRNNHFTVERLTEEEDNFSGITGGIVSPGATETIRYVKPVTQSSPATVSPVSREILNCGVDEYEGINLITDNTIVEQFEPEAGPSTICVSDGSSTLVQRSNCSMSTPDNGTAKSSSTGPSNSGLGVRTPTARDRILMQQSAIFSTDSDLITNAPSVISSARLEFEKFSERAEAAAKLTGTCPPDERLSQALGSSEFANLPRRGLGSGVSILRQEVARMLSRRNKARFNRALEVNQAKFEEIELEPISESTGKPTPIIFNPKQLGRYAQLFHEHKCAWSCISILTALSLCFMFIIIFVSYPAGIQKSLDMTEFGLNSLIITDPSEDSFQLALDITINNKAKVSGELEPMAAELMTKASSNVLSSLKKKSFALLRRTPVVYVHLQKLDMPSIRFSDDKKARIVKAQETYVTKPSEWGDLLAKVFNRQDDVAIEFDGTGKFKKGTMKMQMHIKKSIALLEYKDFVPKKTGGIVDWRLMYNETTMQTRLSGLSQFMNPANVTMYLGDCIFDFVHRGVIIGQVTGLDYYLYPGLNTGVNFTVELNNEVFEADDNLNGSFLSTLMLWDPLWDGEKSQDFLFQVIGKSASINGTEIPWLSKAVQGIKDLVYVLSNSENGTTDISKAVSDVKLTAMQIQFSDLQAHDNFLNTSMTGGSLSLKVRYPVAANEFPMDMMYTTHEMNFLSEESAAIYAKIEVAESDRTTSWSGSKKVQIGSSYRIMTEKALTVDLTGARLTIFDSEIFADKLLRPLMNNAVTRVVIQGKVFMRVDTPLGRATLEPILYAKGIGISGMSIIEDSKTTLELTNVALTGGYQKRADKHPYLEMAYDLHVRNNGDAILGFGDVQLNMTHNGEVVGKTMVHNFTLVPGLNTLRGVYELRPYDAKDNDTEFSHPILTNMIWGKSTGFMLSGLFEPLGVPLGPLTKQKHRGFPSKIRSTPHDILDSMNMTVNTDLKPVELSLAVMNPFDIPIGITFFEGNITSTHFPFTEVDKERCLVTIPREDIAYRKLAVTHGVPEEKIYLPSFIVNPLLESHLTEDDIRNPELDIIVYAKLGIQIGEFIALVPYIARGRKMRFTPNGNTSGGGVFEIVFSGGVTAQEMSMASTRLVKQEERKEKEGGEME